MNTSSSVKWRHHHHSDWSHEPSQHSLGTQKVLCSSLQAPTLSGLLSLRHTPALLPPSLPTRTGGKVRGLHLGLEALPWPVSRCTHVCSALERSATGPPCPSRRPG